jgi:magnesium-transporting ATPase (P-type)
MVKHGRNENRLVPSGQIQSDQVILTWDDNGGDLENIMTRKKQRSVEWILISGILGIIIFLIFMAVLTYYSLSIENPMLRGIIQLLTDNISLIIILSILFMIADIFHTFSFPMNLPGPLFSATASIFLIAFLFNIIAYFHQTFEWPIFPSLQIVEFLAYPLIFVIVLLAGYMSVFSQLKEDAEEEREKVPAGPGAPPAGKKTWEDIGEEFRHMMYDILHRCRDEIQRK